jgi:hypothetical protein
MIIGLPQRLTPTPLTLKSRPPQATIELKTPQPFQHNKRRTQPDTATMPCQIESSIK